MDNLTSIDVMQVSPTSNLQMKIIIVICDSFNTGLLVCCIQQMYLSVEIGHPVYATLFCNLVSVLAASILELLTIPLLEQIQVQTFVKSWSYFYSIFHACTWLVMTVLRYVYIVHNDWVHKTFTQSRTLTVLSISLIYCVYFLTVSMIIPILVKHGWPYIEVNKMNWESKRACFIAVLAGYGWIICLSNVFYVLILHQRGAIGKNSVDVLPAEHIVEANQTMVSQNQYIKTSNKVKFFYISKK